jgi:hypothetical protein
MLIDLGFHPNYEAVFSKAGGGVKIPTPFTYVRPPRRIGVLVKLSKETQYTLSLVGDSGDLDQLYATPSPWHLCAVVQGLAYMIDVRDPTLTEIVPIEPVLQVVRVPERPLMLLNDFISIAAYGPQGFEWGIEDITDDVLEIEDVTTTAVRLSGTRHGPLVQIVIDPVTGKGDEWEEQSMITSPCTIRRIKVVRHSWKP